MTVSTAPDLTGIAGDRTFHNRARGRFIEHVASHPASPRRWVQSVIARPWSWVFEGCRLSRDTGQLVEHAGFSRTDVNRHRFQQSIFFPVNRAISGRATK